ncbi:hypothetical protein [Cupriavidus pauculus]|uniref:hypothetical protein n=1 Tax=Cupriavidus pauculus TaxID=82633 RepID=UPI0015DF7AB3|nr:hypothetical protein [Cupriavidus pauculus]
MDQTYTDENGNELKFQPSRTLIDAMPPEWGREYVRWCATFFGIKDDKGAI